MTAGNEAGFTLVEALVALAILAVTAVGLLGAAELHIGRIGGLEDRALAQIAAENRLAEIELGLGTERYEEGLLGRRLAVTVETLETPDPDLVRLDLTVLDGASGAVVLRGFTGFLDAEVLR